jgi:hypothetical protein
MAQESKKVRVGVRQSFPYSSVKLVLLANGNRHEVDSNTFFFFCSGKAQFFLSIALPQLRFF